MTDYKLLTAETLAEVSELDSALIYPLLEIPPNPDLGDYALPCFKLAKTLRQAPPKIAADLAAKLSSLPAFLSEVRQEGGYLNFFLNETYFTADVIAHVLDDAYIPGKSQEGTDQTVIIEYSSPNIAKPFHLGHAFTTILGESLARIYDHLGYKTERFNHLGDYGTQFGKLMVAYDRWCDHEALEAEPIKELTRIYVKFHQAVENEPELDDLARERFRRLEANEPAEVALWTRFRDLSLKEFDRIYEKLGIKFDNLNGESFYGEFIPAVVEELREKELLTESRGARVVMLDDKDLPPAIILKSDGATIYASRDIAALIWRWNHYHFAKNIYVVGNTQALHFNQVFEVARKMGYEAADNCLHVAFGTVRFPDAKFSTREGNAILLEDVLRETIAKTRDIIVKNNEGRNESMSDEEIDLIASKVGLAAVQYTFLKNGRERDIIFSWDDMLDFNGDTAPYLLYTYARAKSILRRAEEAELTLKLDNDVLSLLAEDQEFALAKMLLDFGDSVSQAARANEPFMVARHVSQLARLFNKYYNNVTILGADSPELRRARLALVTAVCKVLACGLELLGIQTVERM